MVLLPVHKIIGVKVHSRRSCCCYTNTMVQFNVTTDAHEQQGGRGLFGSLFGGNPSVGTLNIEVPGSADTAPLFDYVYGVLGRSGHGAQMHSLAHMIGSGLVVSLDRMLRCRRRRRLFASPRPSHGRRPAHTKNSTRPRPRSTWRARA